MRTFKCGFLGDSLAYLDMVEQAGREEERRERERALIEEGRW